MACDCDLSVSRIFPGDSLTIMFDVTEKVQAQTDAICEDSTGGGTMDLTGLTVTAQIDGPAGFLLAPTPTVVDAVAGEVSITIAPDVLTAQGMYSAQLSVSGAGLQHTSSLCCFEVKG